MNGHSLSENRVESSISPSVRPEGLIETSRSSHGTNGGPTLFAVIVRCGHDADYHPAEQWAGCNLDNSAGTIQIVACRTGS